jgi:putative transposase
MGHPASVSAPDISARYPALRCLGLYDELMPSRLKRYQTEGHYHFVTFSCYRRLPYLNEDHARIAFVETLEKLRQRLQFLLFGYVLMPEHVHLLLSEPKMQSLGTTLSVLKGETSKVLKGERAQFWQTRYYDFNVLTRKKLVEKIRYIHRNPVERGLVKKPEDWRWSSFCHYLTGEEGRVVIESEWTRGRSGNGNGSGPHPSR